MNMEVDNVETVACESSASEKSFISFSEQTSFLELSRSSWHPAYRDFDHQTYLRGCKWSPDGTCCLTVVNNDGVHLIELPKDLYRVDSVSAYRCIDVLESIIHIPENGLIYDFSWYPGMNSMVPETCCWITTGQNKPVQMWDAFDGSLRCSYRGYNAVDEVEAALSVCFSNNASQIHAGYKKSIKTFDVERPGREYVNQKISGSAASLAVSPCHDLIAVGSWKTDISLYSIQEGTAKSLAKMRGHTGGVTQLQFSSDGTKLVSGARKDNLINIWDVRFHKAPLNTFTRKVETNQRIYFDLSKCGKYVISGSTDGVLYCWNIDESSECAEIINECSFPVHKDCCNGVSIHPSKPILATSSGQHHFSDNIWLDDDLIKIENIDDVSNTNISSINNDKYQNGKEMNKNEMVFENSLEFWWIGSIDKVE